MYGMARGKRPRPRQEPVVHLKPKVGRPTPGEELVTLRATLKAIEGNPYAGPKLRKKADRLRQQIKEIKASEVRNELHRLNAELISLRKKRDNLIMEGSRRMTSRAIDREKARGMKIARLSLRIKELEKLLKAL